MGIESPVWSRLGVLRPGKCLFAHIDCGSAEVITGLAPDDGAWPAPSGQAPARPYPVAATGASLPTATDSMIEIEALAFQGAL